MAAPARLTRLWGRPDDHRRVWALALPMIASNITVPLLGLVDTAVMGHMPGPQYLGGVAIGSLIFSFFFWGFGFLRMGATGLTAQAHGADDRAGLRAVLGRSLILAMLIAAGLLALQWPLLSLALHLVGGTADVEALGAEYFSIRIWAVPAILARFVLVGWFIGLSNTRAPLYILTLVNGANAGLDALFVLGLGMDVDGVAWASLVAEYAGLALALGLAQLELRRHPGRWRLSELLAATELRRMLGVNHNIFLRTLMLIFAFAFFTAQSAELGDTVLAANQILVNLVLVISFALDGFAHAAEALVGRSVGAGDEAGFRRWAVLTGLWSVIGGAVFLAFYALAGDWAIGLLTDIDAVADTARAYMPWLIASPLIALWSYWLDGVFIGATRTRAMRDAMLVCLLFYLAVWWLARPLGNHGLWLAMMAFLGMRGLTLGAVFAWIERRGGFAAGGLNAGGGRRPAAR